MASLFQRKIYRQLVDFIEDESYPKNVAVLVGARQVGKTTLLQEIIKNRPHLYFNLEKTPSIAEQIDRCSEFQDFQDYLQDQHHFNPEQQILVIDEAQASRQLGSFVRFMKEEWKHGTVILTGSVISELYRETKRRPVGRETYFELWPMTFKEFLMAMEQDSLVRTLEEFHLGDSISVSKHERLIDLYSDYLKVGGLPEVVLYFKQKRDFEKRRADIFKSYEDDFIRYFSLEEVNLFRRSLEAVAANVGSPSKDSQVVRLDAPGYKKVAGIFSRLEKWRLLIKCEQLGIEPGKNKFFPKRYLFDVGIHSLLRLRGIQTVHLKEIASPILKTSLGGIVENALALSLRVQFSEEVYGIKMTNRAELDFAIKRGGVVYPIECKISLRFKGNYLKPFDAYLPKFSPSGVGFLFYGGEPLAKKIHSTYVLPFYLADELFRLIQD